MRFPRWWEKRCGRFRIRLPPVRAGGDAGVVLIRAARAEELAVLPEVERRSGWCFAGVGMERVAAEAPLPVEVLAGFRESGSLWVAVHLSLIHI